jgi:isoquinoline 1-oxidoreductase beta subunit
VKVVWDYRGNEKLDDQAIAQTLQAGVLAARSLRSEGDFEATWTAATGAQAADFKTVEADYFTPYLNHFTLEPQNCTAWVKGDIAEVWAPTQSAEASLNEAAKTLGLPLENVTVHRPYLGGGYGRRGASQDFVRQAVLIARELGGTPVQLLWSREEDMQHGFYRPAALYRQRAVVSKEGRVLAWQARLASQSLLEKIRPASLKNGQDFQAGESFHDMPYQVAHLDLRHGICQINVPVGFWRSVYHSQNPFARESFLDEVLHAAGKDALRGRLELLPAGGRDYKVLEAAAREANWGAKLAPGRFQGLAVQDAYGSFAACVVELSVSKQKAVTLHQITIAVDSGQVANVDSARAQIEGNVSYALSSIFMNEINVQEGRVTQSNLADYPLVQLRQIPTIQSVLVPSGGEVWGGLGEPPYAPITPAIANAIAAATGVRLRRTPFSHDGFSLA